jgi:hypothetical protein
MKQMTRGYQAITSIVPGPAQDEDGGGPRGLVEELVDCLSDRQASKLH